MSWRKRTDANHAIVRAAFRQLGWYVFDMSRVGSGCPDLLVAKGGQVKLIEVKDGGKALSRQALTVDEARVHQEFRAAGVEVHLVRSLADVEALR